MITSLLASGQEQSFGTVKDITGVPYATLKNAAKKGKLNLSETGKFILVDQKLTDYVFGHKPRSKVTVVKPFNHEVDDDPVDETPKTTGEIASGASNEGVAGTDFPDVVSGDEEPTDADPLSHTTEQILGVIMRIQKEHYSASKALITEQAAELRPLFKALAAANKSESDQLSRVKEIFNV